MLRDRLPPSRAAAALAVAALALVAGCGIKGPLQPPPARAPADAGKPAVDAAPPAPAAAPEATPKP